MIVKGWTLTGKEVTFEFNNKGTVQRPSGESVPLLDVKMMSDERWNELVEESKRKEQNK